MRVRVPGPEPSWTACALSNPSRRAPDRSCNVNEYRSPLGRSGVAAQDFTSNFTQHVPPESRAKRSPSSASSASSPGSCRCFFICYQSIITNTMCAGIACTGAEACPGARSRLKLTARHRCLARWLFSRTKCRRAAGRSSVKTEGSGHRPCMSPRRRAPRFCRSSCCRRGRSLPTPCGRPYCRRPRGSVLPRENAHDTTHCFLLARCHGFAGGLQHRCRRRPRHFEGRPSHHEFG